MVQATVAAIICGTILPTSVYIAYFWFLPQLEKNSFWSCW